jgi:hypothetical protein
MAFDRVVSVVDTTMTLNTVLLYNELGLVNSSLTPGGAVAREDLCMARWGNFYRVLLPVN